jgi:hypothetical protein
MIDLEHSQQAFRVKIPVSESVKSCAQNDVLANATFDGQSEFVFGVSASRGHKSPKVQRHLRVLGLILMLAGIQRQGALSADDAESKWVIKYPRFIQKLMRGAPDRDQLRRPARLILFHHVDFLSRKFMGLYLHADLSNNLTFNSAGVRNSQTA